MKRLAFVVAVLFLAFVIVWLASVDPGYVLIARKPWSVEMSLTVFTVIAIISIGAFYFIIRLLTRARGIPADVAGWRQRRHAKQARLALNQGLGLLAACDWPQAEAQLLAGLRFSEAPVINYIGAAIAAQGQGDIRKRDNYLAEAGKIAPEYGIATGMSQAYLQHLANQQEQALATLTGLRNRAPENTAAMKLLKDTYLALHDWTGIMNLLPDLKRYDALDKNEITQLEIETYTALLTLSLPSGSLEVLQQAWRNIPDQLKGHPKLLALYVGKLIEQGEHDDAEKLLRKSIEKEWNPALVRLYGSAVSQQIGRQLENARSWLVARPKDPDLLLTLGKLALENGDADSAQDYLKSSLDIRPDAETWYQLGRSYERENKNSEAMDAYRRGLTMRRNA